MGFSIINHLFWGTPIYGNPHIVLICFNDFNGIGAAGGGQGRKSAKVLRSKVFQNMNEGGLMMVDKWSICGAPCLAP